MNGGLYYNLSYFLSALIVIGFTLYWGIAKKIPLVPWILSVVTILLFFIAGTRLFSMNKEDWMYFFDTGIIHLSNGRTVLGGIIIAIPGALLCNYYFGLNFDFSKPFALVTPLVVVVIRIGCLLVGCCYGTQSDLPWAICYTSNSPAFINQVNKGLISVNDAHSLPVHPSQVYDIIFYLLIFFVVIKLRNTFKANHSLFFVLMTLRFAERFFLEFVREGESNNVFGINISGLKVVQWTLLIFITLFIFIIYFREKNYQESDDQVKIKLLHGNRIFLFCIFISILLVLVKPWMMRLEMMVIDFMMIAAIVSICVYEIKQIRYIKFQFAPLSMALICFILMSQTVDMWPINKNQKDSFSEKLNDYLELGGGYSFGAYNYKNTQQVQVGATYLPGSGSSGCGGGSPGTYIPQYIYLDHDHQQTYEMYRARGAYKHYTGNKNVAFTFGANAEFGRSSDNDNISIQGKDTLTKYRSSTFTNTNPYIALDSRTFGLGFGIHSISHVPADSQNIISSAITPAFYLRIGDPRLFYFATFYNNRLEDGFPLIINGNQPSTVRLELGSQFNTDFLLFKAGFTPYGYYLAPTIYINKRQIVFSPYYEFVSGDATVNSGQHFGFNVAYRIHAKVRTF